MKQLAIILIVGCATPDETVVTQETGTPFAFQWTWAPVSFFSDFETPQIANWHSLEHTFSRPMADSFALVEVPRRSGAKAGRVHVEHGWNGAGFSERTMLNASVFDGQGNDMFYGFSIMLDPSWNPLGTWDTFMEWHADFGTQAMVSIGTVGGGFKLNVNSGELGGLECTQNPPWCPTTAYSSRTVIWPTWDVGQWHDIIIRVKWRFGPDGIVEVWHRLAGSGDFVKRVSLPNIPTLQWYRYNYSAARLQMGYYRPSWCTHPVTYGCMAPVGSPHEGEIQPPSTLYLDNMVRARWYAAARQVFDETAGVGLP